MRLLSFDIGGVLCPQHAAWALETGLPFSWVNADYDLFRWLPALSILLARCPDVVVMTHSFVLTRLDPSELAGFMSPLGAKFVGCVAPRGARFLTVQDEAMRRGATSFRMLHSRDNLSVPDGATELIFCPPDRGVIDAGVQRQLRAWLDGDSVMGATS